MSVSTRFQKQCVIGRGSYGTVYLAKTEKTDQGKYIVQKEIFLSPEQQQQSSENNSNSKETTVAAAIRETQLQQSLGHPNVIKVFGAFASAHGSVNIVMEFVRGGDLAQRISHRTSLKNEFISRQYQNDMNAVLSIAEQKQFHFSERRVVHWGMGICLSLSYLHAKHVIHRDIKTANVLLTSDHEVKQGDFGVARQMDRTLDNARTQCGTPFYISPEVCKNESYNQKSDVWAMGVVLYELAALRRPFLGDNILTLVRKIVMDEHVTQTNLYPGLYSSDLSQQIDLMLSKNPSDRPDIHQCLAILRRLEGRADWGANESVDVDTLWNRDQHTYLPFLNLLDDVDHNGDSPPGGVMDIQRGRAQSVSEKQRPNTTLPPSDAIAEHVSDNPIIDLSAPLNEDYAESSISVDEMNIHIPSHTTQSPHLEEEPINLQQGNDSGDEPNTFSLQNAGITGQQLSNSDESMSIGGSPRHLHVPNSGTRHHQQHQQQQHLQQPQQPQQQNTHFYLEDQQSYNNNNNNNMNANHLNNNMNYGSMSPQAIYSPQPPSSIRPNFVPRRSQSGQRVGSANSNSRPVSSGHSEAMVTQSQLVRIRGKSPSVDLNSNNSNTSHNGPVSPTNRNNNNQHIYNPSQQQQLQQQQYNNNNNNNNSNNNNSNSNNIPYNNHNNHNNHNNNHNNHNNIMNSQQYYTQQQQPPQLYTQHSNTSNMSYPTTPTSQQQRSSYTNNGNTHAYPSTTVFTDEYGQQNVYNNNTNNNNHMSIPSSSPTSYQNGPLVLQQSQTVTTLPPITHPAEGESMMTMQVRGLSGRSLPRTPSGSNSRQFSPRATSRPTSSTSEISSTMFHGYHNYMEPRGSQDANMNMSREELLRRKKLEEAQRREQELNVAVRTTSQNTRHEHFLNKKRNAGALAFDKAASYGSNNGHNGNTNNYNNSGGSVSNNGQWSNTYGNQPTTPPHYQTPSRTTTHIPIMGPSRSRPSSGHYSQNGLGSGKDLFPADMWQEEPALYNSNSNNMNTINNNNSATPRK